MLERRCEQGKGSGEEPAVPGEAWGTQTLRSFSGMDPQACVLPSQSYGTRRANSAPLGGSTGWRGESLCCGPSAGRRPGLMWCSVPLTASLGFASPCPHSWLGAVRGWVESPAWDESGETEPQSLLFPTGRETGSALWAPGPLLSLCNSRSFWKLACWEDEGSLRFCP